MTHDELLDAINKQIITAPPFASGGYTKFLQGLSAVVELHTGGINNRCVSCSHGNKCETIQAIEKELG